MGYSLSRIESTSSLYPDMMAMRGCAANTTTGVSRSRSEEGKEVGRQPSVGSDGSKIEVAEVGRRRVPKLHLHFHVHSTKRLWHQRRLEWGSGVCVSTYANTASASDAQDKQGFGRRFIAGVAEQRPCPLVKGGGRLGPRSLVCPQSGKSSPPPSLSPSSTQNHIPSILSQILIHYSKQLCSLEPSRYSHQSQMKFTPPRAQPT